MEYASIVYKCRKCGKTYKSVSITNIGSALESLIRCGAHDDFCIGKIYSTCIHDCADGSLGIADLIGAEYDD